MTGKSDATEYPNSFPLWPRAVTRSPPVCRTVIVQVERGVDQRQMRECLREIAQLPARARIVLLRPQPDIVAQPQQPLEQRARLALAALQDQVVGEPEAAREEQALARRQAIDRLLRAIAEHETID